MVLFMSDNYDFSDAVKNPFAGKIKGKYTVTIYYDFTNNSKVRDETMLLSEKSLAKNWDTPDEDAAWTDL